MTPDWPNKSISFLSGDSFELDKELIYRLERRGWTIRPTVKTIEDCHKELRYGQTDILIINDSVSLPSHYVLRSLLTDKFGSIIPIIVLSNDDVEREKLVLSNLCKLDIVVKPFLPGQLIDSFDWILRNWNTGNYRSLRRVRSSFAEGKIKDGLKVLADLIPNEEVGASAAICFSLFLRDKGDIGTAEKVLLNVLKGNHKHVGVILSLVDLYINAAMPYMAKRLLKGAELTYSSQNIFLLDQIQIHFMMNQLEQTLPYFNKMVESNYMLKVVEKYLPRVLYSTGHEKPFGKSINNDQKIIKLYHDKWGCQFNSSQQGASKSTAGENQLTSGSDIQNAKVS